MHSVYQHWNQLKVCMVGKSYSPEFYSWIANKSARNAMERIAQETEEDYQSLIKILESFNVKVIRPEVDNDHHNNYNTDYNVYNQPPMTPRDYIGVFDNVFVEVFEPNQDRIGKFYHNIKDESWPHINNIEEFRKLPKRILDEVNTQFNLQSEREINFEYSTTATARNSYLKIMKEQITDQEIFQWNFTDDERVFSANNASVTRVGKDLFFPGTSNIRPPSQLTSDDKYRLNFYNGHTHADSCFAPVVPGLIVTLKDYQNYKDTFPEWEVVELKNQSWDKVQPFIELKAKNGGKWWIPGEENNNILTELVEEWLGHWVGYVEETVFDTNMLIINKKNVIVNNYNKQVFDAFDRHGITPHICNFRHRYFWDGGLHCITADLHREGEMEDYFPERDYKTKSYESTRRI